HATHTLSSPFNPNPPGRNGRPPPTLSLPTSPEIVPALAFAGTLEFDPVHGTIPDAQGKPFRFTAPEAEELPRDGFARGAEGYEAPADDPDSVQVMVRPNSARLQILEPFSPWDGRDFVDLPILVHTKGTTQTDQLC